MKGDNKVCKGKPQQKATINSGKGSGGGDAKREYLLLRLLNDSTIRGAIDY